MSTPRTRGTRRDQTWRHSRRVRRIEHAVNHGVRRRTCDCADALGPYHKRNAFQCRCHGKTKGAPKVAGSLHKGGGNYRMSVLRRIWNRRLARAWGNAVEAGDPDDCELPSGPIAGRRHTYAR